MDTTLLVVLVFLFVLSIVAVSFSLYIFLFFRKLSRGIGRSDLIKILTHLSQIEKGNTDAITGINRELENLKKEVSYNLQKVSLVQFNPFSELGGNHSFSLALLDKHLTGFLITGLHTRERTRVYVKKIEKGKCKQDLSKEEKEALEKASE